MNAKLFSEAMSQLDSPYIVEALVEHKPKPFRVRWWKLPPVLQQSSSWPYFLSERLLR